MKMDVEDYTIDISHHAFKRALQRRIYPDMVEATIKSGKRVVVGKNYVKFVRSYGDFSIQCVGQVCGLTIKVITVTRK